MDIIYRFDPHQPLRRPSFRDPDVALQALREGNERFATIVDRVRRRTLDGPGEENLVIPSDPLSLAFPVWGDEAPVQSPFALVLGCSDARAPVEVIFDQACNDLFVVRIAGNVLGVECLGSIDYAVSNLADSLQTLVVLGHTGCGAVGAAVDTYLDPNTYADIAHTHALRSLVERLMIVVRGAAQALKRECGVEVTKSLTYRAALVEVGVYLNAAVTAFDLRRERTILGNTSLRVVYGVYDLSTQRVRCLPGDGTPPSPADESFARPPEKLEDFVELGSRVVQRLVAKGTLK